MDARFNHIFGLSRKAPDCLGASTLGYSADDVEKSLSGLYLDEMDALNLKMLDASYDCGEGSIWQLMYNARRNALLELETSLLAGINIRAKQRNNPYLGFIGQPTSKGVQTVTNGSTVSLALESKKLDSVSMQVRRIGLLLDSDATVSVSVTGLPGPVEVVAVANIASYITLPEPLTMALDGSGFTVSYVAAGFNPLNNKTSCGCSTKDRYLSNYFDSIMERPAYGIILDISIGCAVQNLINLNYDARPDIANVTAYAAMYKTGELLIERIINSTDINRYTMMDTQFLWGKRNHFRAKYQEMIVWLVNDEGLDLTLDSCYVCKNANGFTKRGILV